MIDDKRAKLTNLLVPITLLEERDKCQRPPIITEVFGKEAKTYSLS